VSDTDLCVVAQTDLRFHDRMGLAKDLYHGDREPQVRLYLPPHTGQSARRDTGNLRNSISFAS